MPNCLIKLQNKLFIVSLLRMYPGISSSELDPKQEIASHYALLLARSTLFPVRPQLHEELRTNKLSQKLLARLRNPSLQQTGDEYENDLTQYAGLLAELHGKTILYGGEGPPGLNVQNLHDIISKDKKRLRRDSGFFISKNNAVLAPHPNQSADVSGKRIEIDAGLILTDAQGNITPLIIELKITTAKNELKKAMRQSQINHVLTVVNNAFKVNNAIYMLVVPSDSISPQQEFVQSFVKRGNVYVQMPDSRQVFLEGARTISTPTQF
ncbi:MAG: hypothetical protein ACOCXT_01440 [Candidatus Dojkabacteria bacterium]